MNYPFSAIECQINANIVFMNERDYCLGFSVANGIGPIKFNLLLSEFKTAEKAWNAKEKDLKKVLGVALTAKFFEFKSNFSLKLYAQELKKRKVSFLTTKDKEYPKLLSQISNPPFVLYIKGNIDFNLCNPFGIVGTRKITNYGREVTEIFSSELSSAGYTIVSGLALGVDAAAHKSAIDSKGKTIAVLGCGVDCVTPAENESLYNSIVGGYGAVVSEYPLGHPPTLGSFPSRNRIIAGLSLGVLVTEGAEDSGSLITAEYALKFKRPVFAVPGPITSSLSKGPYSLIQKGAKLVTSSQDIISELGIKNKELRIKDKKFIVQSSDKDENLILKLLENEPLHFDEIVRKTNLNSSKLGSILSLMEVKGIIKNVGGGEYLVN